MIYSKKITLDTAERAVWGKAGAGWMLSSSENLSIAERLLAPGVREIKHYHEKSWQFFYVLEGVGTMTLDDDEIELNASEAIEVAAGAHHQMMNSGDVDLKFLVVSSPDSVGDRVELE